MPRNKDLKRLVRTRMTKTGESYTAARAVLVRQDGKRPTATPYAAPRKDWPSLAGMKDAVVKDKTGRTWAQWVAALDDVEAHRRSHREIARLLSTDFGVGSWWTQMVAVGYERIRGLRVVGQRSDGSFNAGKSRTFPVDVATLYAMGKEARRRRQWLPEGPRSVRSATDDKLLRFDWSDGTRVQLFFEAKGPAKSTLTVDHAKLGGKAEVARMKAYWNDRLDALARLLGSPVRA